ncbi:unnamed protein product [Enterobius vermicularis]|uniref:Archease domain-containing protein n=1 Tax=Enterobius vermicularis TaxID=51028 RepID=A0A0N4VLH5_ENTVE|nr:unnamed protein product [Enterobius vermicularis]
MAEYQTLNAAYEIGISSLVSAEDLADPSSDHLGIMALAAALISLIPETSPTVNLDLAFTEDSEIRVDELDVVVIGPDGTAFDQKTMQLCKSRTVNGAVLSVIPTEVGFHKQNDVACVMRRK